MITHKKLLLVLAAAGALSLSTNRCRGMEGSDSGSAEGDTLWSQPETTTPTTPPEDTWATPAPGRSEGGEDFFPHEDVVPPPAPPSSSDLD